MCGIAGLFSAQHPVREIVGMMNRQQSHRGPDDEGLEEFALPGGRLALGHRRLSIIDLSASGHQPMTNPATGDCITFNGEIYNFRELRAELEGKGASFHSQSDTEVILHAFHHWGVSCLARLHGMFSLAIYQPTRRRLFLARDPLGIKPLYYAVLSHGFAFASELRPLLGPNLVPARIAPAAQAGFLAYGSVQDPLTIVRGVLSLPAGTWMDLDLANPHGLSPKIARHWSFPRPLPKADRDQALQDVRQGLELAVQRHLISDVPVGVFLSSGLDSTSVAALACAAHPKPTTFTVSLGNDPLDEAPLAEQTSRRLGVSQHIIRLEQGEAIEQVYRYFSAADQPTLDGLNTFIISGSVGAQGLKVALSGLGGDELFGGYKSFVQVPLLNRWMRRLPMLTSPWCMGWMEGLLATTTPTVRAKALDLVRYGAVLTDAYFCRRQLFSAGELATLGIHPDADTCDNHFQPFEDEPLPDWLDEDPTAAISLLESRYYMRNTLLRDADTFGMTHGLEIRVPFLDRQLIDLVFRLPGALRGPHRGVNKPLLVGAMGSYIEPDQSTYPKRGFNLPYISWLRGSLRPEAARAISISQDMLKSAVIEGLWRKFCAGDDRLWSRMWALMAYGKWCEKVGAGS